ncbi:MAG TPA: OmpA family protein [Bacteroidales bacterium]|nr:OmpA family protein [Bacteroidales bacterium]
MKTNLFKSALIAILLFATTGVLKAQDDAEGCKDHPLFNRMPNYYLFSCEELEFGSMKFPVGEPDVKNENKMKTETVKGKIMVFVYALKDDAKPASGLQIMLNFQNASKQNGGVILGEYQGWCTGSYEYGEINSGNLPIGNGCTNWSTTFKFTNNNKEIWVYEQYSDNGYEMVIAEKEAMKQDIQANEMFDKINAGEALTLYINFETGKSAIKAESQNIISELYQMLSENDSLKITIEGHTDNVGTPASNKTLSEQRATSVKTALVNKGISADRIKTVGYGQEKPIADNSTDAGKAKNRRVEIMKQ